tara:strand:- start:1019 stop:1678 length:660 start_codon:yes stop_codon:yes gene_type:complete
MFQNFVYGIVFDLYLIKSLVVSIACGLIIRLALPYCQQNWVQTLQHTLSYAMLPPITFVITKVISGNIALSLGMIGALSIVRFRTPVKNPLELIIFFALITIGISSAVDIKFAMYLTILIVFILFLVKYLGIILTKFNLEYPSLKYSDGNSYNTIEVVANKQLIELESEKNLVQMLIDNEDKNYIYKFVSTNSKDLKNLLKRLEKHEINIKSTNSNFIN